MSPAAFGQRLAAKRWLAKHQGEMRMDSMSLIRWLVVAGVFYALIIIPVARIMRRAGRSSYWSILALIPVVSFIGRWVFAFTGGRRLTGLVYRSLTPLKSVASELPT
jgi:bacteriorhodopsin